MCRCNVTIKRCTAKRKNRSTCCVLLKLLFKGLRETHKNRLIFNSSQRKVFPGDMGAFPGQALPQNQRGQVDNRGRSRILKGGGRGIWSSDAWQGGVLT